VAFAEARVVADIVELIEARVFEYMLWRYEAVGDDRTCPECAGYDGEVFEVDDVGELLDMFPYGSLRGATVYHPNVHPNCRCVLKRIYTGEKMEKGPKPSWKAPFSIHPFPSFPSERANLSMKAGNP
jgi:hypothetical protein